jgi:hypothetical protein
MLSSIASNSKQGIGSEELPSKHHTVQGRFDKFGGHTAGSVATYARPRLAAITRIFWFKKAGRG